MTSGYSGTPLAKKLSLKDGMRMWRDGIPESVAGEVAAECLKLTLLDAPHAPIDAAHVFVTERSDLEAKLHQLMPLLATHGFIWVSWPKKAARRVSGRQPSSSLAKVATDITEDRIREICLPMGLVDVKVCAVDETWSGLKLMKRRSR
jgi:hypothetical protein